MKIIRKKRRECSYTKPSVRLIELESVTPLLAQSNSGSKSGNEDTDIDGLDVFGIDNDSINLGIIP